MTKSSAATLRSSVTVNGGGGKECVIGGGGVTSSGMMLVTGGGRRTPAFMSSEDVASGKRSRWFELEITGHVRNVSPSVWQLKHLTALYMNENALVQLPASVRQLTQLTLLDMSHNQLKSVPAELGDLVNLRELFLNHNQLRIVPYELGKLFQLQLLALKGNPLRSDILAVYQGENGTQRLLTMLLDNLSVNSSQPPQRPWIPLDRPCTTRSTCIFTVMCYNVLCEKYATRQMYGYCPKWALDWEYRKKFIMQEIRNYSADIITLQEVQTDQFYDFFLPELQRERYTGIFSPKSRAKTMAESERKFVDGCAIFWRTDKFTLVKEHLIEFNQLAMANAEGSDDMLNRVMTKDNIGLAAMLETHESAWENNGACVTDVAPSGGNVARQRLLVCTAHIHWDPEYCDVKLIQCMMLLHEIGQIMENASSTSSSSSATTSSSSADAVVSDSVAGGGAGGIQLLLCGDLNSLPDSGVVEFLVNGRVSADHRDFKELGYRSSLRRLSECVEKPCNISGGFGAAGGLNGCTAAVRCEYTHPFRLTSSYAPEVMPFTNFTHDFRGIIDYIFHSRDTMTPLGVLGPLDADWLRENKVHGCPHPHIPSDHFSLLVELEMCRSPPLNARAHAPLSSTTGSSSTLHR